MTKFERNRIIVERYKAGGVTMRTLAEEYGIKRSRVQQLVNPRPRENAAERRREAAFAVLDGLALDRDEVINHPYRTAIKAGVSSTTVLQWMLHRGSRQ